jgi:non-specific serine/threonine protein kinase
MSRVFISYSRKDLAFVQRLAKDLKAAGLDSWYDLSGLEIGSRWGKEIQNSIQQSQYFLVVLSPDSIASEWVEKEFLFATSHQLKIIPILHVACELPMWCINLQFIDLQKRNYKLHFDDLLKTLGVHPGTEVRQLKPVPSIHLEPAISKTTHKKPKHNLPVQLTSFIGREKEIAEVKRLLNEKRLVTITGPGGTGKTRLSLQVATDLLDTSPDGVWLVELAPLADPALVPQAVATALGVREQLGRSVQEALTDFLREKDLLLILDNCEHMVDACATLADTLLHVCPGLKILASSREALGIAGEVPFRLPSLSIPDIQHLPPIQTLLQYEAVRLFIERATTALSTFTVTDDNAPALAQVCHRLDGIPLAIELAAARVRMLSVEQIAARLDDCFRLLTGGSRTALPRLQTLRALIDWSYNLLSASECTLLRRLSVFVGGWTLEAAEAVCASTGAEPQVRPEEILDLLTSLVNKSLVMVAYELDQEPRYRLLETIRQYVLEKLSESGEGEPIRNQHLGYFLKLAERAEQEMQGAEQKAWFDRLEVEHDNFRAALRWSLESGGARAEAGLRVAGSLWWFWDIRGYKGEGIDWLERTLTLSASQAPADLVTRAKALCELGVLKFDPARLEEGLALARTLGPAGRESMALAFWSLGACVGFQADYVQAKSLEEEGLKLFRELGIPWGICDTLTFLGRVNIQMGDYQQAAVLLEESLRLARQTRNGNEIGFALWHLGLVSMARGDYEQATPLLEESLAQYKEIKNYSGITYLLGDLGIAAIRKGDTQQATSCYKEALTMYWELGYERDTAVGLEQLAHAAVVCKQPERAARLLGAAEALRESSGEALYPYQRPEYESCLEALRPQLDEATLAALWAAGRAMTVKQAVAYALEETPS